MTGPAQFGYGNDGEITTLSYGTNFNNRYITAYFRKAFVVANPASFNGLLLRLLRDDGAVVYLNGVEVLRNNLQPGQVSWNSLALSLIDPPFETTPVETNLSSTLLLTGTNMLAVELHQASIANSDARFDLALIGLTATNTADGVYITSPGNNAHFNSPAQVPLAAFAQSLNAAISLVEYFDGTTKIGQAASSPYALTWNGGAIGAHSITARATYGGGLVMTSPPVSIVISAPPPPIAPVFQTLVSAGSSWKYWDSATAVGANWQNGEFDDAAWPSGAARFGWGLDGEVTQLTSGRTTHYFRRWFTVANPSQLTELTFQLLRDDGAVVYLNGVEIFRSNMPTGPVSASTPAATTVNTPEETAYFETVLRLSAQACSKARTWCQSSSTNLPQPARMEGSICKSSALAAPRAASTSPTLFRVSFTPRQRAFLWTPSSCRPPVIALRRSNSITASTSSPKSFRLLIELPGRPCPRELSDHGPGHYSPAAYA